jgi:hypothetical protein
MIFGDTWEHAIVLEKTFACRAVSAPVRQKILGVSTGFTI